MFVQPMDGRETGATWTALIASESSISLSPAQMKAGKSELVLETQEACEQARAVSKQAVAGIVPAAGGCHDESREERWAGISPPDAGSVRRGAGSVPPGGGSMTDIADARKARNVRLA